MASRIPFPDPRAAADVITFARRASRLGDGTVRLRAADGTLAITTAVLAPQTLLDTVPTVLGMRVARTDPELVCDLVVDGETLALSNDNGDNGGDAIVLPPSAVMAAWAGIAPPRTGWEDAGVIAASVLAARAQWGIAAVAHALPDAPGEDVVRTVRAEVWGAADDDLGGLPRGAAFAAFGLGFIAGDEQAAVRRSGVWTRLSLPRGHVLVRLSTPPGLGPVRATGASR